MHGAALVRVGGALNARVVGSAGLTTPERGTSEIAADLQAAARHGARTVVLVGGEPTLRRDLRRILSMAGRLGMNAGLATNGRMLAYAKVRAGLVETGVQYVRVALHAADPALHDAMVRVPGAHAQTLEGMRALALESPKVVVEAACTLTRGNVDELEAWLRLVSELPARDRVRVRLVAPEQGDGDWPRGGGVEAAGALLALAAQLGIAACWEGFPPCRMEPYGELRDEALRREAPAWGPPAAGTAIPREEDSARQRPWPCHDCSQEPWCPGAPAAFVRREGESALAPVRALQSNSFNFERVRELQGLKIHPDDCGARVVQGEPDRQVIFCDDGGAALYRTDTADFSTSQIRLIKNELQQVYLDRHARGTLNEFLHSVQRARTHDACAACEHRDRCCRAMVLEPRPAFEDEERWIRVELSALRGRVLDVGCGDQLYRELVRGLIASGAIEYHGLDPDERALERLRKAGLGGTLHCGEIETFDGEPGSFDHVLALRSPNHFRDMHQAFTSVARLLRSGGQFVLCDSIAYAMLRTREQAEYADDHAPVGHEHWRNWSSHTVLELAARFPFRVEQHLPVHAGSCNEWIVKLTRV